MSPVVAYEVSLHVILGKANLYIRHSGWGPQHFWQPTAIFNFKYF